MDVSQSTRRLHIFCILFVILSIIYLCYLMSFASHSHFNHTYPTPSANDDDSELNGKNYFTRNLQSYTRVGWSHAIVNNYVGESN